MCDSDRCSLLQAGQTEPSLTQSTLRRQKARLKRCFKALNDGQMVNPIEVMSLLSQVCEYVDVAKWLNCDKSQKRRQKKV